MKIYFVEWFTRGTWVNASSGVKNYRQYPANEETWTWFKCRRQATRRLERGQETNPRHRYRIITAETSSPSETL